MPLPLRASAAATPLLELRGSCFPSPPPSQLPAKLTWGVKLQQEEGEQGAGREHARRHTRSRGESLASSLSLAGCPSPRSALPACRCAPCRNCQGLQGNKGNSGAHLSQRLHPGAHFPRRAILPSPLHACSNHHSLRSVTPGRDTVGSSPAALAAARQPSKRSATAAFIALAAPGRNCSAKRLQPAPEALQQYSRRRVYCSCRRHLQPAPGSAWPGVLNAGEDSSLNA